MKNNHPDIEEVLHQAPPLKTPPGLLDRLRQDIKVPQPANRPSVLRQLPFGSWHWLPKLAWGTCFLACMAVLGSQVMPLSKLRQENADLKAAVKDLTQNRQDNLEYQKLQKSLAVLERVRQENVEAQNLRNEVNNLRAELQQLPQLILANQQLLAQRNARQASDPYASALNTSLQAQKDKAERISCINNLKQLGLAARIWAVDHNDINPTDILAMKKELNTPKILICPSDKSKNIPETLSWDNFNPSMSSYGFISPGSPITFPDRVLFHCPIHHNVGLIDGSVQALSEERYNEIMKAQNK